MTLFFTFQRGLDLSAAAMICGVVGKHRIRGILTADERSAAVKDVMDLVGLEILPDGRATLKLTGKNARTAAEHLRTIGKGRWSFEMEQ